MSVYKIVIGKDTEPQNKNTCHEIFLKKKTMKMLKKKFDVRTKAFQERLV